LTHSDACLIERAKEGHGDAFTEIYQRYQPSVYNYIYYRVGSAALAEELTSEVFVRLVDRAHTLKDSILGWLYTVARNLTIDRWRRNCHILWQPLDEELEASEATYPARAAEQMMSQEMLAAALRQLTESQRQVIILKFIEGLTNGEVADVLGKDEGAIKSLQHRALITLRRLLQNEECYGN
jgi:RNA polymerase sigma-70 factor, ECF subfamily